MKILRVSISNHKITLSKQSNSVSKVKVCLAKCGHLRRFQTFGDH